MFKCLCILLINVLIGVSPVLLTMAHTGVKPTRKYHFGASSNVTAAPTDSEALEALQHGSNQTSSMLLSSSLTITLSHVCSFSAVCSIIKLLFFSPFSHWSYHCLSRSNLSAFHVLLASRPVVIGPLHPDAHLPSLASSLLSLSPLQKRVVT